MCAYTQGPRNCIGRPQHLRVGPPVQPEPSPQTAASERQLDLSDTRPFFMRYSYKRRPARTPSAGSDHSARGKGKKNNENGKRRKEETNRKNE